MEFYCEKAHDILLGALAAEFLKVITQVFGHSFGTLMVESLHRLIVYPIVDRIFASQVVPDCRHELKHVLATHICTVVPGHLHDMSIYVYNYICIMYYSKIYVYMYIFYAQLQSNGYF